MKFIKTLLKKVGLLKEEPNPDFLSPSEIVKDIVNHTSPKGIQSWLDVAYEDLIQGHMFIGMAIRNTYHLWHKDYPYAQGKHPDDLSMEIMQAVWKEVHARFGDKQA